MGGQRPCTKHVLGLLRFGVKYSGIEVEGAAD